MSNKAADNRVVLDIGKPLLNIIIRRLDIIAWISWLMLSNIKAT
jgi:hypothetical protein